MITMCVSKKHPGSHSRCRLHKNCAACKQASMFAELFGPMECVAG